MRGDGYLTVTTQYNVEVKRFFCAKLWPHLLIFGLCRPFLRLPPNKAPWFSTMYAHIQSYLR